MHNLEAHSSGVIFTAMQQSGTSEPSVQVKSNPDVSRLSRVLNQQETLQPEIATTSGSDKPDFVNQQITNPQQEKALVSDTAVLSDISICQQQQQQQPEKTLVSETMPIQPDTDILTTNDVPPVNDTVEVLPTQQVETDLISKPEPILKEVISSELSVPEEEEEILHFDIRNISPEPMPEPLSFEQLQENIQRKLQRAKYLRDAGIMPSEDLVKEINEIGEQLSKSLKRTLNDISKEATASLPQKV
ncbi:hypothetical protein A2U01_0026804, partial [Trifolium medium]|nr:hypothetical protein [Trifolium medium]